MIAATRAVNIKSGERYDVYIGRAGHGRDGYFGNPYRLRSHATASERAACLEQYRAYFETRIEMDAEFRRRVLALRGQVLGCFCAPQPCHGDVIVAWLEATGGAAGAD
jgi:hypothetical protein